MCHPVTRLLHKPGRRYLKPISTITTTVTKMPSNPNGSSSFTHRPHPHHDQEQQFDFHPFMPISAITSCLFSPNHTPNTYKQTSCSLLIRLFGQRPRRRFSEPRHACLSGRTGQGIRILFVKCPCGRTYNFSPRRSLPASDFLISLTRFICQRVFHLFFNDDTIIICLQ